MPIEARIPAPSNDAPWGSSAMVAIAPLATPARTSRLALAAERVHVHVQPDAEHEQDDRERVDRDRVHALVSLDDDAQKHARDKISGNRCKAELAQQQADHRRGCEHDQEVPRLIACESFARRQYHRAPF